MELVRAESLNHAIDTLSENEGTMRVISGGTALVLMLKQQLLATSGFVDVNGVSDADFHLVRRFRDAVHLGAGLSLSQVAKSSVVRRTFPSLAHACQAVGNPRIRNAATLGGSLAEADYASDPTSVLISLKAICVLEGPGGRREVPCGDLATGYLETVIGFDEVLTSVVIPTPLPDSRAAYTKFRSRTAADRACVGLATSVSLGPNGIADMRIVVGAVMSTPQYFQSICERAVGHMLTDDLIDEVGRQYSSELDPISDSRGTAQYRRHLVRNLVRRDLTKLRDMPIIASGDSADQSDD